MKENERAYLRQCFLNMVISGCHTQTRQALAQWAQTLELAEEAVPRCCAVVRAASADARVTLRLQQQFRRGLSDWGIPGHVLVGSDMDVILVLEGCPEKKQLRALCDTASRRLGTGVQVGLGNGYCHWDQLQYSREEAYEALAWAADQVTVADIGDVRHSSAVFSSTVRNSRETVLEHFRRGEIGALAPELERLAEVVRSATVIHEDAPYPSGIRRTMIELMVEMLHIASDAGVDVDAQIRYEDPYRKIFELMGTPAIIQWVVETAGILIEAMQSRQAKRDDTVLAQVKAYIRQNLSDMELSLTSVSAHVGMTPAYLSAFFIREAGMGFKEYVTARRIALACDCLKQTRLSINAISERCGFLSASYFIKVFRDQMGMTPGAYRKLKN